MQTFQQPQWLAMSFSERLASLRKAKGFTQQSLADKVDVHITQIQRYESGATQPALEIIRNLAVALSVSADMLIFDENEREPSDDLKLQFEAVSQFDDEDKQTAQNVLEGLILKHQAKQSMERQSAAKKTVK